MLMVILFLVLLGLCLGSFVNALVWRLREQSQAKSKSKKREFSILRGRSVCPHCKHQLGIKDLVPVLSWLSLGGKCRYCKKKISVQYPLIEILTATALVVSYLVWPYALYGWTGTEIAIFGIWTLILTGLIALAAYDIRWYILPDKITVPITVLGLIMVGLIASTYGDIIIARDAFIGVLLIFGIFCGLSIISKGKWIGDGDVKLGVLLGLLAGSLMNGLLLLFLASVLGTLYSFVLGATGKQKFNRKMRIPFGPFLIAAAIITVLFGTDVTSWYSDFILSI